MLPYNLVQFIGWILDLYSWVIIAAALITWVSPDPRNPVVQFLHKVLEIDREAAEIDACKIEHLLSPEAGHQILALVQLLLSEEPSAKAFLKKLKKLQPPPAPAAEPLPQSERRKVPRSSEPA